MIMSQGKCGLGTCTTRYLVAMAAADLLVIISEVILRQLRYYYYPVCFLGITPVCSVIHVLIRASIDCSVWFTVAFTFDRFVSFCCHKLKTKYCTGKNASAILSITSILLCLKNVPWYFTFEPRKIIRNIPFYCKNKGSYYTDSHWIGFRSFAVALTPLVPFFFIVFLNVLTIARILFKSSQVRKGLRGQSKEGNQVDPEMKNRTTAVILLSVISGNFIVLWLLYVLFIVRVPDQLNVYDYDIFKQVGYMLRNVSCCTNTLIYMAALPKFRAQFNRAVKYPVSRLIELITA
ncbi:probable G-protein coupled receptor 139 [Chiloscyllium plagiosum]|uniref:probable G-protein coupled receptor 139 n=1 Tax=Chiloscyllium plagiosum TaxID=36176 RepID=UPI001CB7BE42|nr:probable G-protein coupled receptor 139 [Chiloscyllium plagiosum]